MKKILTLIAILLLITTVFTFAPVTAVRPTIKVGIIGPQGIPHWGSPAAPCGMWDAAQMARDEINVGGININGTLYDFQLVPGNEYAVTGPGGTPEPQKAHDEVVKMITQDGVKFLIGGFRTECTGPMINASMDYNVPFFINGASTDWLISETVPKNYTRYKYLFRGNPVNSTVLFKTVCGFLGGYLIPKVMLPLYGAYLWPGAPVKQVRVAVVTEQLEWTNVMHYLLTLPPGVDPRYPAGYQTFLGPNANLTYQARLDPTNPAAIPGILTGVKNSMARVLIHVFSAPIGVQFIGTWAAMGVQALPTGINVMDQLDSTWNSTGGGCQYECMLEFAGTRTPITPQTQIFWDNFVARTHRWPIYTAYGAYDALYALKETLEKPANAAAVLAYLNDPGPPPYATSAALVPAIEATDRQGLTGRFRYTPEHDVYLTTADVLSQYYTGNIRAMMVQWTGSTWPTARKEVVWPIMHSSIPYPLPYARMVRLPPVMYPLVTDINYDGKVDGKDIAMAASAFGSQPGDPRWKMEADLDNNGKIDGKDIAKIAKDFGKRVTLPLP